MCPDVTTLADNLEMGKKIIEIGCIVLPDIGEIVDVEDRVVSVVSYNKRYLIAQRLFLQPVAPKPTHCTLQDYGTRMSWHYWRPLEILVEGL